MTMANNSTKKIGVISLILWLSQLYHRMSSCYLQAWLHFWNDPNLLSHFQVKLQDDVSLISYLNDLQIRIHKIPSWILGYISLQSQSFWVQVCIAKCQQFDLPFCPRRGTTLWKLNRVVTTSSLVCCCACIPMWLLLGYYCHYTIVVSILYY